MKEKVKSKWLPWRRQKEQGSEETEEQRSQGQGASLPGSRRWLHGLRKARQGLVMRLDGLLHGRLVSEEVFAELEEVLLGADVGVKTTALLLDRVRERCRREGAQEAEILREYLKAEMQALFVQPEEKRAEPMTKPWVIMVIGVNGVGKTTSIAKLAVRYRREGMRVLLVAADTFRAAATEQLDVWAQRVGAEIVKHQSNASPAAVAFDGIRASLAREIDVVIIDTAGRLHTRVPLMEELRKVERVVARELPGAPHEILLVLDATTGQNAIPQAHTFQKALSMTGVILAKLDGTGKGGVVLAVTEELGIPIRYVGLGQEGDDLQEFSPAEFVSALFNNSAQESSPSLDITDEGQ
jgi:fused signal recognition particle receptor